MWSLDGGANWNSGMAIAKRVCRKLADRSCKMPTAEIMRREGAASWQSRRIPHAKLTPHARRRRQPGALGVGLGEFSRLAREPEDPARSPVQTQQVPRVYREIDRKSTRLNSSHLGISY